MDSNKTVKRMISIPEMLNERLKNEPNASALIVHVLENHYTTPDDDEFLQDTLTAVTDIQDIVRKINTVVSEIRTAASGGM